MQITTAGMNNANIWKGAIQNANIWSGAIQNAWTMQTFGVEQFKMQTFAGEDQTLINSVELCIHIKIYIYKN